MEESRSLSYLGLERAEDMSEEWVLPSQGEDSLLHHRTLNVIIHQHHVLLQGFHSKVLVCALQLSQEHLKGKQLLRKREYLFSEVRVGAELLGIHWGYTLKTLMLESPFCH